MRLRRTRAVVLLALPLGAAESDFSCDASFDLLNTITFAGAAVLGTDQQIMDSGLITSASGFNYAVGAIAPAFDPLPASGLLLLGGLAALVGYRRKYAHSAL